MSLPARGGLPVGRHTVLGPVIVGFWKALGESDLWHIVGVDRNIRILDRLTGVRVESLHVLEITAEYNLTARE